MPMGKKVMISRVMNQKGFTLIEVFAAISIIAIAVLGLVSVTVKVIKGNTFSKTMTAATTLASDKMEQLTKSGYASLASGTDSAQSIYARTWTVTEDSPAVGMKTVVVTVQWTWEGIARNVAVRRLIAQ